jgi:hypothetical protein
LWQLSITSCVKVGESGDIVAAMAGVKPGERCRIANFVALWAAASTRSAAVVA